MNLFKCARKRNEKKTEAILDNYKSKNNVYKI